MFGRKPAKRDADSTVMVSLASAVSGQVTRDGHLRGTYRARPVNAWLEILDPRPLVMDDSENPRPVDTLRLQLAATGTTPWSLRSEPRVLHLGSYQYEFVRDEPGYALLKLSPFSDLVARPDRTVEARLQDAGLLAALTRIAPAELAWLPRVSFVPDPRAAIKARMMASGIAGKLPPDIAAGMNGNDKKGGQGDARVGLMIDIPRSMVDLSPHGFAALLDGVIAVAELNERVNPAT
jgi:hypothetical protein